ncbi:hypothetical protein FGB62_276g01 [Gracilaria domingensis]|nr:hypothetical protein FGB62_276g01 [Gracilaria domingensis]
MLWGIRVSRRVEETDDGIGGGWGEGKVRWRRTAERGICEVRRQRRIASVEVRGVGFRGWERGVKKTTQAERNCGVCASHSGNMWFQYKFKRGDSSSDRVLTQVGDVKQLNADYHHRTSVTTSLSPRNCSRLVDAIDQNGDRHKVEESS